MTDMLLREPAASTQITFEHVNAYGVLHQIKPRLAAKVTELHNYAKILQTMLRAVDFYCEQYAVEPRHVRIETVLFADRIVQRISG
jgi:hypothetical protein